MNRRAKRQAERSEAKSQKIAEAEKVGFMKPVTLTKGELSHLLVKADHEGYVRALRTAIETSFGAYTIVLGEMGFTEEQLMQVHKEVSDNVFGELDRKGIDLSDIPVFAKHYGVDLLNGEDKNDDPDAMSRLPETSP